jgi:hypothetical protein
MSGYRTPQPTGSTDRRRWKAWWSSQLCVELGMPVRLVLQLVLLMYYYFRK